MSTKRDSNAHRVPPNPNPNLPDFIHLRYQDSEGKLSGQGGITIAYRRIQDSIDGYEVAVARCCPTDNFSRKIGRQIASGFLKFNNLYVIKIAENASHDIVRSTIILFVMRKYSLPEQNKPSVPTNNQGQTLH